MSDQQSGTTPTCVSRPLRLGLSANLSQGQSVHRQTFLNAVAMALEPIQAAGHAIELNYVCDGANAEQAEHAAKELTDWAVDLVVGHFASAAAAAASAVYRQHDIPLLLPAATANRLVDYGGAFRICGPDRALARILAHDLRHAQAARTLTIQHDMSLHGEALGADITAAAHDVGLEVVENDEAADALVFVGQFPESVAFLKTRATRAPSRLMVLTDDAVSPELEQVLPHFEHEVLLYGFCPPTAFPQARHIVDAHVRRHRYIPGVYFLETYAALEIVHQYLDFNDTVSRLLTRELLERTWQSVLGPIRFINYEGGTYRYGRWRFSDGHLDYEDSLVRLGPVPATNP